jgi:hypothetical protein
MKKWYRDIGFLDDDLVWFSNNKMNYYNHITAIIGKP